MDTVTGSGKDGRVTKNDILNFVQSQNIVSTPTPKVIEVAKLVTSVALSDQIIEITRMRKVISERMVSSKRNAPQATCLSHR